MINHRIIHTEDFYKHETQCLGIKCYRIVVFLLFTVYFSDQMGTG